MRARKLIALAAVPVLLASTANMANADDLSNNLDATVDATAEVMSLTAGGADGTTKLYVVPRNDDGKQGCNIQGGESVVVSVTSADEAIATVSPASVTISGCEISNAQTVTVTAKAQGSTTVSVAVTANNTDKGTFNPAPAAFTVNVAAAPPPPPPANTKPTVSVTGVAEGGTYEIGSVPVAGCEVTDAEDSDLTATPVTTGTLSHGLGQQTVTCDATDSGGLKADTQTATYTIVDTGDPTIDYTLSPANGPNGTHGWYTSNVTVTFDCDDAGSGIQSCVGDTTLSSDGANQSVTGTATDWAGNTASATASGINIDKTAPTNITHSGVQDYYFGDTQTTPTCTASDATSDLASCVVTGGGTTTGQQTWTATATDNAGNQSTDTMLYNVHSWTVKGFYSPVDLAPTWNTIKGGSTVPLKFELFAGTRELTDVSAVAGFSAKPVACPNGTFTADPIEVVSTGGTTLRYDTTGGQFIQNWQTPKKPGACYNVTMTAQDGSVKSANFQLK